MSVASFQSESANSQTERSKTGDPIEIHAKTMKYLRIEFSDEEGKPTIHVCHRQTMLTECTETSRFKQIYARLYKEEISRPLDFFLNWQLNAEQQRAESVISTSPSGTPFTMSPVLHPIRNQASNQEG